MRARAPTLAALAIVAAGALVANVAENRLLAASSGSGVSESGAHLEDARLRLHRDGVVRYNTDVGAMRFAGNGAVALDSVEGRIGLDARHVAFRSERGAVGPDVSALELHGSVRLELEAGAGGQASVVHADSAVLRFKGAAELRAQGNVRIAAGRPTIEAASLEWRPGGPLRFEGVRARIP